MTCRLFLPALAAASLLLYTGCAHGPRPLTKPLPMPQANVLPLALDDTVQFRKTYHFLYDPKLAKPTQDEMINFERLHVRYGAITAYDQRQRFGHYYTFFWRAKRPGTYTIRFEYRQQNLGSFVQAREATYENVKGSEKTHFNIIGDDYNEDGRITSWRCVIIENGRIVALNQSYLWR